MGPGTYEAKVVDAKLGYSKNNNEQIAIKFETNNGSIVLYGSFSPNAERYTREKMMNCGWDGDFTNVESMVGAEVQIVVEEEEYQGKKRNRVKFVNEKRDMLSKAMTPEQVRQFAAKMGQDGQSSSGFDDGGAFGGGIDDDDIPF